MGGGKEKRKKECEGWEEELERRLKKTGKFLVAQEARKKYGNHKVR